MQKIGLITAASWIAFGSLQAAEPTAQNQQGAADSLNSDAGVSESSGDSANPRVSLGTVRNGVISAGASSGTVVSRSGGWAPVLAPITPFVSYAPSGHVGNDEELQKLLREVHEREQKLLQNPEYRDLLRARQRVALSYSHFNLPELLQVSREQADQLLDLLAEQQVREQAANPPMDSRHANPAAAQQFIDKAQERQRANEAEIAALLGAAKFQEWKEYEQSAMARIQVQRLQEMLPPNARLRPDQLRPLMSAIAREQRQSFDQGMRDLPQGGVPDEAWHKRMQENRLQQFAATNQRILDGAASILSPKQLQHLEAIFKQDLDGMSQQQFFFLGGTAPLSDQ